MCLAPPLRPPPRCPPRLRQTNLDLLLNLDDDVDMIDPVDPRLRAMKRSNERMRDTRICELMQYEDLDQEEVEHTYLQVMGPAAVRVNMRYDIKRRLPNFADTSEPKGYLNALEKIRNSNQAFTSALKARDAKYGGAVGWT